jgi:outer membrane protein OmpA-like peptidoglycan-associated protein
MRTWIVACSLGLCACSQPVVFQGQSTLPITGTLPRPAPVAEVKPPRVEVRDDKIEIHDKIQFDFDQATIKPVSFGLMNEIARVIVNHPQLKRLRIEGHASGEGDPHHNQILSEQRARAVLAYLSAHGVPAAELSSAGYGADRPIADNTTEQGREQNRRVELLILEQDVTHRKVAVDATTGKETVVEERQETVRAPDVDATAHAPARKPASRTTSKKGG